MSSSALSHDVETGMAMSEDDWLRLHFESCAAGYADQLAFCERQTGSRILDVGCGTRPCSASSPPSPAPRSA